MGIYLTDNLAAHPTGTDVPESGNTILYPLAGVWYRMENDAVPVPLELDASQVALVNSALQAGNNVSELTNDAGYQNSTEVNSLIATALGVETTARQNADTNLQNQIDTIGTDQTTQDSAIQANADNIALGASQVDLNNHVTDTNNPHQVTAVQVGTLTTAQINTAISTAINNLINGAPGALDTLNELAQAITDNDADLANLVNSIAQVQTNLNDHEGDFANPHQVTKAQIGLGNVDNTSDANKPVSTAQQTALDLKADQADLDTTNTNVAANATAIAAIPTDRIESADTNTSFDASTAEAIVSTNGVPRIIVQADGDIGFGTNDPIARFHAQGDAANQEVFVVRGAASQSQPYFQVREINNTQVFQILANGNADFGSNQAKNLENPTDEQDAATRAYVYDAAVGENTPQINDNVANQIYLSNTFVLPAAGDYIVSANFTYSHDSTTNDFRGFVNIDGTDTEIVRHEPQDAAGTGVVAANQGDNINENSGTDQRYTVHKEVVLTGRAAGNLPVNINWNPSSNGVESTIYSAVIRVKRLTF